MSDHPEITAFVDLARGVLADDEVGEILAHCRQCEQCGTDLAVVLLLREEEDIAEPATAPPRISGGLRRWMALAAMFVLGAAVGVFAADRLPGISSRGIEARPVEPAETVESPFPSQVPAPRLIAAVRVYDEILARADLLSFMERSVAGAPRGKTDARDLTQVSEALSALAAGRVDAAVEQLEELYVEYPYDADIAGYLGIALFYAGERGERVEDLLVFALSTNHGATQHVVVRLYLARLYLGRGEVDKSLRYLAYIATRPYLDMAGEVGVQILGRVREELGGA